MKKGVESVGINVVASKAPRQGTSLGSAHQMQLDKERYNRMKSNIDISGINTDSMRDRVAETRAREAMKQGQYTPVHTFNKPLRTEEEKLLELNIKEVIRSRDSERGGKALLYKLIDHHNSSGHRDNVLYNTGHFVLGQVENVFSKSDDMGSQMVPGTIIAGKTIYTGIKAVQGTSDLAIAATRGTVSATIKVTTGIVATGKGVWDVSLTVGKATVTLARTAGFVHSGFIPLGQAKDMLIHQVNATGLLHTATSQKIISAVNQIKTGVQNARTAINNVKTAVVTTGKNTVQGVKTAYTIVRGVIKNPFMATVIAHQTLLKANLVANQMASKGIRLAARGVVKGGVAAVKVGVPKAIKGADSLSSGVVWILKSANVSNDMMIEGAANTIKFVKLGIKTGALGVRATGYVVKTSAKATVGLAKGVVGGVKGVVKVATFIRNNGLRAAWQRAMHKLRVKTARTFAKVGHSLVNLAITLVKMAGRKIILPIIIVGIIIPSVMSLLAAPTAAVGSIFSGLFDRNNEDSTFTEADVRQYISDPVKGIPGMKEKYIADLYKGLEGQLVEYGGSYHIIRYKTNNEEKAIQATSPVINESFYTVDQLTNIIQPIFNAVILKDYDLSPTEKQAQDLVKEIFDSLFHTTHTTHTEYCGQSLEDGNGTFNYHSCGRIHAHSDCVNLVKGTHSGYVCNTCCSMYCPGHYDIKKKITTYCSGCKSECSGYEYCGGHGVYTLTLNMDGLYELLYRYFEQPIDELATKTDRTKEEDELLQELKDSYDVCLEMIKQVSSEYGSGLGISDLSGVKWTNGSREGNKKLIDLALTQEGQVGGEPYWRFMNFSSRVEWCACFVSWCMYNAGDPNVKFAHCQNQGIPYFKSVGRWAAGNFKDLAPGDVIFFDWKADGIADHVGLVIGTDDKFVYTIEGNSGDVCRIRQYDLDSTVIAGYGLMNW